MTHGDGGCLSWVICTLCEHGFPRGGSCQRPRPLTDEWQPCRCRPLSGCRGTRAPHSVLRGHLPPKGKASRTLNSPQTRNIPRRSPRPRRCPRSPSTNTQCQNSSTCLSQGMRLCRRLSEITPSGSRLAMKSINFAARTQNNSTPSICTHRARPSAIDGLGAESF